MAPLKVVHSSNVEIANVECNKLRLFLEKYLLFDIGYMNGEISINDVRKLNARIRSRSAGAIDVFEQSIANVVNARLNYLTDNTMSADSELAQVYTEIFSISSGIKMFIRNSISKTSIKVEIDSYERAAKRKKELDDAKAKSDEKERLAKLAKIKSDKIKSDKMKLDKIEARKTLALENGEDVDGDDDDDDEEDEEEDVKPEETAMTAIETVSYEKYMNNKAIFLFYKMNTTKQIGVIGDETGATEEIEDDSKTVQDMIFSIRTVDSVVYKDPQELLVDAKIK